MRDKYTYILPLLLVLLCTAGSGCQQEREHPRSEERPLPASNADARITELLDVMNMHRFDGVQTAPDFELMSVTGEKVSLRQYRGKVVLLSFWATW